MKITIRLAHPPGSKLHPPTPSPKMGEEEPEGLKVPLPPWERDLAIILDLLHISRSISANSQKAQNNENQDIRNLETS